MGILSIQPTAAVGTGTFVVTGYGAIGDGSHDDTSAIQSAVNACAAAGGGVLVIPKPQVGYLLTDAIQISTPNIRVVGHAPGTTGAPVFTQATYGKTIFNVSASRVVIENLSGQYGQTTTLAAPASVGATTIQVASASLLTAGDWLILNQPTAMGGTGALEQVQIAPAGIAGTTISLTSSLQFAHASGAWVRDQSALNGPSVMDAPARDLACFANFYGGDECQVVRCAASAMVTGVKLRGNPASNQLNTFYNVVDGVELDFVQFGILATGQSSPRVRNIRYTNATGGQTTAPGHCVYFSVRTGFAGTWASGTTYSLYQQVAFGGFEWISLQAGNVGHQPDTSPTFWTLARTDGLAGYLSFHTDVQIANLVGAPGFNFKDWSFVKEKCVNGGTTIGIRCIDAVRVVDIERCTDLTFDGFSASSFIPPSVSDSSAAAINLLNCDRCLIANGVVNLTQSDGSAIDMPVVLNRVSTSLASDPNVNGRHNKFFDIEATSNYSAGFTSAAFRITGAKYARFESCKNYDSGTKNNYVFRFSQDTTDNVFPDLGQVINPTVAAPNVGSAVHVATVDAGTTGVVLSLDGNLLPAGYAISDPGSGAVITNSYVANAGGNLTLSPQSTSADVVASTAPASAGFKWLNLKNSAGNSEVAISNASGVKASLLSSSAGNGSFLGLGSNATGGFPASAATIGGLEFVVNGAGLGVSSPGIYAVAAESQNAGALGTDLLIKVIAPGGTTIATAVRFYGTGDVSLNATGSALATSATAGFTFLPSMAGIPTGSVSGHTGTVPVVYDSTNQLFWFNTSSTNWFTVGSLKVTASGPANGTNFVVGSMNRVGSSQSGFSYVLPDATKSAGSRVVVQCTNATGQFVYTFTSAAGNINGSSSYVFKSDNQLATVAFLSDGTNWFVEAPVAAANYTPDSPAFHGYVEWNQTPDCTNANPGTTGQVTTGNLLLMRIVAQSGGLVSNINVGIASAGTLTAATTGTITNIVNNGSGLCRVSSTAHGRSTNDVLTIAGVVGTTEANGAWVITVIDANTYDLVGSAFVHAYTSGGTWTLSPNAAAIYDANGAFLTATGDMAATWNGTGFKTSAFATPVTLVRGSVYYVGLLFNGTAATLAWRILGHAGTANGGLTGAKLRWSTQAATKLLNSFTPSTNSTSNIVTAWVALS